MSKPLVLVIEDQQEVRENLMETLELANYETIGAENGHLGFQMVKAHMPNIVLCDVMMPKLDGYGVLGLLKNDPETSRIPFVFLTAKTEREDLRRGMNLGAADYITKPFFQDELLRVVGLRIKQLQESQTLVQAVNKNPITDIQKPRYEEIIQKGRDRQFKDRSSIYFLGDQIQGVYYVKAGRVNLYKETEFGKRITIDAIGEGSWFGLDDLYAGGVHTVSACACPEAEVTIVEKVEFIAWVQKNPDVLFSHLKQLSQDLALRAEQIMQIAYYSVRKRVAEFLVNNAGNVSGQVIDLRREDIAEATGTTSESVTRVLTEIKKEGLIKLPQKGGIIVLDIKGLSKIPA